MEKKRKSDSVSLELFEDLWSGDVEVPFEDFVSTSVRVEKIKEEVLSSYPDADNFKVVFSFKEAVNYERYVDFGWLKVELVFDRTETDDEFEERKRLAMDGERGGGVLLEADRQNRIAEAKRLLEENGYVVVR